MRCQSCGHENPEDAGFCGGCGNTLARDVTCPHCGRVNLATENFCHGCGKPLSETPPAARTPTPAPALPASFASGRYQVQRFLGEGAKKRVYLAHDSRLDRDVAIALIKSEGLTEEGIARVQREGQAMGQLGDHPHISPLTTPMRRRASTTSSWSTWREATWRLSSKATTARGYS